MKKAPESGIIKGGKAQAGSRRKAEEIEQAFRYVDEWGDAYSPIDVQSFAAMPEDAQEQAADGIRTAKALFGLGTLPDRIAFGDVRGGYGMYSETSRTLTLSRTKCKDPAEARSTMIHELTHYYDQASDHIAEKVYKQALKELGIRANSNEVQALSASIVGVFNIKDHGNAAEIFGHGIEKAVCGSNNKLAQKMLEIVRNRRE